MAVNFTPEQQAAVDFRGKRLLVSAAAGSGKTRMLVGRVVERIERERLDLEDFLIITFTRAAAAELRDRFSAELASRAAETGDRHLRRQTTASKQNITTIDALCAQIIHEYSHLVDIAGYRIASDGELEKMRVEARAAALERIYADTSGDAAAFREAMSYGRSDRKLAEAVEQMYDHIREHPFPDEWKRRLIDEYSKGSFDDTHFGAELAGAALRQVRGGVRMLEQAKALLEGDDSLNAAYGAAFDDDLKHAREALKSLDKRRLSDAYAELDSPNAKLETVRGRKGDPLKERVQTLRNAWKKIKERAAKLIACPDDYTAELAAALPAVRGLLAAADIFGEELMRVKSQRRAAEFGDFAHATVKLLAERRQDGSYAPSAIAETYGSRFREVLVDEFQDTNEIQTMICDLLTAGEGRSLFMVGDVKQSIYRFRLARPEIFLDRYRTYPDITEGKDDARASLTQNFRSRAEVLELANYVFRRTMDGGAAEIEYDDAQRLYPGRTDEADDAFTPELCMIDPPEGSTSVDAYSAEAVYVAGRVRSMLRGELLIPDGAGGKRPPKPEEIAVLLRNPGGKAWLYRQAFENLGIPCGTSGESGVSVELLTLLSVLTAVDNPYLDVPLVGAMLSPVFGFTADELALIRAHGHGERTIYGAVRRAARDGNARAAEFIEKLEALRREAGKSTADKFILHLYAETPLVGAFSALPGGAARRERLNLVYMKARAYARESRYGLHGFIEYLEGAVERGEIASGGDSSGVTVTSVHKSKGLEFAVVFYSALTNNFNFADTRGDILLHPELGAGIKICDRARRYIYPSGAWCAISERIKRETLAEELRIVYVAMTRAREKLIMTFAYPDARKKLKTILSSGWLDEASFVTANSPAEWLLPLAAEHPCGKTLRTLGGTDFVLDDAEGCFDVKFVEMTRTGTTAITDASQDDGDEVDEALLAEIAAKLEYDYPAAALRTMPSKLTATQIRGLRSDDDESVEESDESDEPESTDDGTASALPKRRFAFQTRRPRLITQDTSLTPTERGTAIHTVMQFARFEELETPERATAEVERLEREKFVTPEQAAAVKKEVAKLCDFHSSDLCRRALASPSLRREFKFSLLDEAQRYFPVAGEDERVLLQGVCDMFFEEDGELVVVDFKSDRVSVAGEVEHAEGYAPQLDAYARALERIFGIKVRERLIYFFATGHTIPVGEM